MRRRECLRREFHKELDDDQKRLIRNWIESGAKHEKHWGVCDSQASCCACRRPLQPDRCLHPAPIAGKKGFPPAAKADRRTLIRRLTLDLTGLPPTPEEVSEFVNSSAPDAYENLVDRLTSQTTYGEHMARYWLDLARYADTHGLHLDNERSMWPYRDWVVRAFAENVPFDEFTRWQLAGDLLENPSRDQLIASGFNRCNVTTSEGGSIADEWVFRYAVDRTTTAAEVWLGLTAGCAVLPRPQI